ncbi:MAG: hypothetical protein OHK0046_45120 [Anaerolineae bacterium]
MSETPKKTLYGTIVPRNPGALTVWQPKRALPVAGAAVVIWAGRKVVQALVARAAHQKNTPLPASPPTPQTLSTTTPIPQRGRRVIYRLHAEIHIIDDN